MAVVVLLRFVAGQSPAKVVQTLEKSETAVRQLPDQRAELEPLLRAAIGLQTPPMRLPDSIRQSIEQHMLEQVALRRAAPPDSHPPSGVSSPPPWGLPLWMALAIPASSVLIMVVVILTAPSGRPATLRSDCVWVADQRTD